VFEEQMGAKEWCKKLANPLIVTADTKYRIVLSGRHVRPHPGHLSGAPPKMTKEQRQRAKSKAKLGKQPQGGDPFRWTDVSETPPHLFPNLLNQSLRKLRSQSHPHLPQQWLWQRNQSLHRNP
jgi:FtsP/CotA-like multicopper oxidase with cupredoxin domain